MKNLGIILVLFLIIISVSTLASADENNNAFYTTLEGKLLMSGNEPFVNLLIKVNQSTTYSISGEYLRELKKLTGATTRITGLVKKSRVPGTSAEIEAIKYSIITPKDNLKLDWAEGRIYISESGYVLIGDDQIVYNLINLEDVGLEVSEKTKVVLFGEIDYYNDFYADFSIQGYNILSKPKN